MFEKLSDDEIEKGINASARIIARALCNANLLLPREVLRFEALEREKKRRADERVTAERIRKINSTMEGDDEVQH